MAARLAIHVQPRASRNEIVGWRDGALRVRLTSPPVEGAANKALIAFLADALGLRRGDVTLMAGPKSRSKVVEIAGVTDGELAEIVARALPDP
jgi:uncharacterized protein (TIGR00251 family)